MALTMSRWLHSGISEKGDLIICMGLFAWLVLSQWTGSTYMEWLRGESTWWAYNSDGWHGWGSGWHHKHGKGLHCWMDARCWVCHARFCRGVTMALFMKQGFSAFLGT